MVRRRSRKYCIRCGYKKKKNQKGGTIFMGRSPGMPIPYRRQKGGILQFLLMKKALGG